MAYKMPKVSKSGPQGLAKIQVGTKTGRVKVTVTYKDDKGTEITEEHVLDKASCPPWTRSGIFRVKFSGNKDKLFTAVPANEQVICQFKDISHEEGQLPTPRKVDGGKYDPYLQFILVLTCVEGPFKGMEIPVWMRYNFIALEDGDRTVAALPSYKTARHLRLLEDTLYALGILDYGPLKWEDNLLPKIQKRAMRSVKEKDTKVVVTLGPDGYVTSIGPVVTDLDEDGEDLFGDLEGDDTDELVDDGGTGVEKSTPISEPDPDEDGGTDGADEMDFDANTKPATDDDGINWGEDEE